MAKKKSARTTRALQARVSAEDYRLFEKAADKDRRSLSSWVRDRLYKAAKQDLGE